MASGRIPLLPFCAVLAAALLAAAGGVVVIASADLKPVYQGALLAALLAATLLLGLPNRRTLLVVAWVLVHPLSLEKVFRVGDPILPGFLPPTLVISGSDVALLLLLLSLVGEALVLRRRPAFHWPAAATPFALLVAWSVLILPFKEVNGQRLLALPL